MEDTLGTLLKTRQIFEINLIASMPLLKLDQVG